MENPVESSLHFVSVKTMAALPQYCNAFTVGALRALIFKAGPRFSSSGSRIKGNGLFESGAIIKVGRRILINIDAFDKWLLSNRITTQDSINTADRHLTAGRPSTANRISVRGGGRIHRS